MQRCGDYYVELQRANEFVGKKRIRYKKYIVMIEEDLSGNSLKGGLGEPGTRVESPNPRLSVIYATS